MNRIHLTWIASAGIATIGLGCASAPLAIKEVSRAEAALGQAEANGGAQYAALEMRNAREKLERADKLSDEGAGVEARRAAEEAEVDAQLAFEKARRAKALASVEEIEKTVGAMEEEMTDDSF